MIHKTTRSILSVLLAALLLVTSIPLTPAFAGEEGAVSLQSESGERGALEKADDGTYLIYTAENLKEFAAIVNGTDGTSTDSDANAKLMNNIDLKDVCGESNSWTPIGNSSPYSGTFNGDGHTISGLYIDITANNQGLFGYLSGTVQNLSVSGSVKGDDYVGGIAGQNGGRITDCAFSGSVSGSDHVGGVVGLNSGIGNVKNCYNTGKVSGTNNRVGGVVGSNSLSATVTNCYNTGTVTGPDSGTGNRVGGVVGENSGSVTNCYNTGSVSGDEDVGGVVGYHSSSTVENCYNTGAVSGDEDVGGVVGYSIGVIGGTGTVTGCYFLQGTAEKGLGNDKDTEDATAVNDLNVQSQFKGWDFTDIWRISQSLGFPVLQDNAQDGLPPGLGTEASPYEISTADQLKNFRDLVNGEDGQTADTDAHAKLMNDIDLSEICGPELDAETSWTPIGSDSRPYSGNFNGDGHTISGLYINNSSANDQGLFGYVGRSGTVQNLSVSGSVKGHSYVGGVVGDNNGGTVTGCIFSGSGSVSGSYSVGGVVGYNSGSVTNCYNTGSVTGVTGVTGSSDYVGGVVGRNFGGTVENCYNTGKVSGPDSGNSNRVGGVVGYNSSIGNVKNCYNTGSVSGPDSGTSNYVGGVVGWNDSGANVENCYNTGSVKGDWYVGGVVGYNDGASVTNCYFLKTADVNKDLRGIGENVGSGDATEKDNTAFHSGEVAWRLQNGQKAADEGGVVPLVWGQSNLKDKNSWPTLVALDKNENAKPVYKVAFISDNTEIEAQYANSGMSVTPPEAPTKTDHLFGGWFNNGELTGDPVTGPISVTGNATYTAKWTPHTYSITASPSALDFGSITEGEERPAAQNVTITNSGNQTVTLKQPTANNFGITTSDSLMLAPGETATFTVQPKAGLAAGSYSEEITITGSNDVILKITATLTVSASDPDPTPTPTPDPTPSGPSTGDSTGWDDILEELENTAKGDQITIDMGDETKVPAEIFESLAGKDVEISFDLGDIQWSASGADIPTDTDFTDLDLGVNLDTSGIPVNVINTITGEVGTVQITLAHNGEFGFTMTLTAPLGKENAGYWANLYHYDEEAEALNFEAAVKIDEDGSVKIPFTHASQYAIVIDTHNHAAVDVSDIFVDVAPNAWYKDAVQYAYDQGLMTGVSATEFDPEATTTRAMIVSILARLEGVTTAEAAGFADVTDEWYATAVNWAANVGVVNGYEDNTFQPNTAITREQLAAILMNYAACIGQDVSARASLDNYTDQPSTWAQEAISWSVAEGLLTGVTADTLQPQGAATRAQVAAILQRFLSE